MATIINEHGRTPLMEAVIYLDYDKTTELLKEGADPNFSVGGGQTAIVMLAYQTCFEDNQTQLVAIAKLLVSFGANINQIYFDSIDKMNNTALGISSFNYDKTKKKESLYYYLKTQGAKYAKDLIQIKIDMLLEDKESGKNFYNHFRILKYEKKLKNCL